jgi:hypothetical protein
MEMNSVSEEQVAWSLGTEEQLSVRPGDLVIRVVPATAEQQDPAGRPLTTCNSDILERGTTFVLKNHSKWTLKNIIRIPTEHGQVYVAVMLDVEADKEVVWDAQHIVDLLNKHLVQDILDQDGESIDEL